MIRFIALVLVTIAIVTAPLVWWPEKSATATAVHATGIPLVPRLAAGSITGIRIAMWSEIGQSAVRCIELHRNERSWTIPGIGGDHPTGGNPKANMLTTMLAGITTGRLVGNDPHQHAEHRLLDPLDPLDPAVASIATVGTRVTLTGKDGAVVGDFIIGDQVAASGGSMFVRQVGHNEFWTAKFDPTEIAFHFSDFIDLNPAELEAPSVVEISASSPTTPGYTVHRPDPGTNWIADTPPPGMQPATDRIESNLLDLLTPRLVGALPLTAETLAGNGYTNSANGTMVDVGGRFTVVTSAPRNLRMTLHFGGQVNCRAAIIHGQPAPQPAVAVVVEFAETAPGAADADLLERLHHRYDHWIYLMDRTTYDKLVASPWYTPDPPGP